MRAVRTKATSLAAISVTLAALGAQATRASGTTEPAPAPSAPATSSGFSVAAALAELPAELVDDAPLITMADLEAVTSAAGLTTPDSASTDDYVQWLSTITGHPPSGDDGEVEFPPVMAIPPEALVLYAAQVDELVDAVGFDLADVSWFADATAPPSAFTVYAGSFDESTLSDSLTPVEDGIVSLGDGEDFAHDVGAQSPLSGIGVAQRLAYQDGRIAVSPDTSLVRRWLAGPEANDDGDDDELAAVAAALDEAGAISAVLGSLVDFDDSLGPQVSPEQREAVLDQLGGTVIGDEFDEAVGIGWNAVDGASVITIVYSLDDGADGDAAAAAVQTMFDEGVSLRTMEPISEYLVLDGVHADGDVVVATLRPGPDGRPGSVFDMLRVSDLPFTAVDD